MDRSGIEQILGSSEFFKGLEQNHIEKIAGVCQSETYEVGEYVFQQGDFGEHLYIIAQGQVFLELSRDLGDRTGRVLLGTLGKGRVMGCWSTLLGESHTLMSSATCQKPTTVVSLKGEELRNLMTENPEFGFHIMEKFCFLLRERIQAAYGALEKI